MDKEKQAIQRIKYASDMSRCLLKILLILNNHEGKTMTAEEKEFLSEVLGVFRTMASVEHNIFAPIAKEYAERTCAVLTVDAFAPKNKNVTTNPMESTTVPVTRKEEHKNAYTTH